MDLGYCKESSELMAEHSNKFLWPELHNALSILDKDLKQDMIDLLSKLIII
jgi:hypothetical protein